jgi:acetyltransferase-like isoleucine patch superfamily enzyme
VSIPGLYIGRRTYHAPDLKVLRWGDDERVDIGAYCSIGPGVTFIVGGGHRTTTVSTWTHDQNFGPMSDQEARGYKHGNIVVGNDVWIATGAIITNGVTIGDGAVIHPGAVVFEDVGPYGIVRGNPAAHLRHRFSHGTILALRRIKWWDWTDEAIAAARDDFYGPVEAFVEKYGC